jgi:hypothetical protein
VTKLQYLRDLKSLREHLQAAETAAWEVDFNGLYIELGNVERLAASLRETAFYKGVTP